MITADIQSLSPGAIVELFELDLSPIGLLEIYRFHAGVNELGGDLVFGGSVYYRYPVAANGFELSGQGALPRPKIQIANAVGLIGALAKEVDDLVGARITRIRTFLRYLDAENFPGGVNPEADPNQVIDREIWCIDRKSSENNVFIEFELAAAFDAAGIMLPRRQVVQNVCSWRYRSAECGYTGGPVADRNDQPVSEPAQDICGKRLSSCRLRFGVSEPLPFGAFPASGLIR